MELIGDYLELVVEIGRMDYRFSPGAGTHGSLKKKLMMKKSTIVFVHLLAWIVQYLVLFVMFSILINTSGSRWIITDSILLEASLYLLPAVLVPFYAFYFLWQGMVQGRDKWIWYLTGTLILLGLPLLYLIIDEQAISTGPYLRTLVLVGFIALLGFLFRGFFNGMVQARQREAMHKQQLENELNFLKGQISPHFLFNTLNNIDSLISADPETASGSLISLSDVMRYMIYKTGSKEVWLSGELENLENVISLYRLRYKKERSISYQVHGDSQNYMIPPMLLIPVVENAFKHFSRKHSEEGIFISVVIETGNLTLTCTNPFDPDLEVGDLSGFGLQTLKRRLALLFPERYELEIQSDSPIFSVRLQIPLNQ